MRVNGSDEDDPDKIPVIEGGELAEVVVTASSSNNSLYSGFNLNLPTPDLKSTFFGNHVDGAYKYVLSPKNIKNYEKMQKAKREGEWGLIKASAILLSPIILPELIAYGTITAESKFSIVVIKTATDVYTQTIFSDSPEDVNVASAIAGAVVPSALSGAASEATSLVQKEVLNGSDGINNQDITSAILKSTLVPAQSNIASGLMKATGKGDVAAEVVGAAVNQLGSNNVDDKVKQYIKP